MFHEYAVDPSLLCDVGNCQTVFFNLKPQQGRLLSDCPRKWVQEAFQAINNIPHEQCLPVMRKSLKSALKRLLDEGLCTNRAIPEWDKAQESWLEFAAKQHRSHPFAAVLAANAQVDPVRTYALSNLVLDAPECWGSGSEATITRKAGDIVDALEPLFVLSRQVVLVDMHLYPGENNSRKVLVELLRRSGKFNYGRGIKKILVHSSDHRQGMQKTLETALQRDLPAGVELEYRLWPQEMEHDRFALSDVGGIQFGHGLDEAKPGKATHVFISAISDAKRRSVLAKLSGTPTYSASIRG